MKITLLILLLLFSNLASGQLQKFPSLNFDRRTNMQYIDSLIRLGLGHWQVVNSLKRNPETDSIKLNTLSYLAYMYRYRADKRDSSVFYTNKLLELSKEYHNSTYELKAIMYLATFYQIIFPNYPKALNYNHQAIRFMEKYPNLAIQKWQCSSNLGEIFMNTEQFQKALEQFRIAQKEILEHEKAIPNFSLHYTHILQQIGNVYRRIRQFEASEKYLLDALSHTKPTKISTSLYYLFSDLGELKYEMKQFEEAKNYFLKAQEESTKINSQTQLLDIWAWLAIINYRLGNYEVAINYAKKSLVKDTWLITEQRSYETLYLVSKAKKDWENAFFYYNRYNSIIDTLVRKKNARETIQLQNQFELDQIALNSRQAQQLQEQKLLAFQNQAEIDRLKAEAEKKEFYQQTQQTELEQKLRISAIETQNQAKQSSQQSEIERLKINELNQSIVLQNRTRSLLLLALGLLSMLGITLIWYTNKLRKANSDLTQKNKEIEEAFWKGQTVERKRVSADLHDEIGSALSTIAILSDLTKQKAKKPAPEIIPELERIGIKSREMIQTMRDTIWSLNEDSPQKITDKLYQYSLETLSPNNILMNWQTDRNETVEMPFLSKRNLLLAYKEALNNIIKHSEATKVDITLKNTTSEFKISIKDNGKGFDSENLHKQGNGLKNFQKRMDEIGGKLDIQSTIGKGTMIEFTLPKNT